MGAAFYTRPEGVKGVSLALTACISRVPLCPNSKVRRSISQDVQLLSQANSFHQVAPPAGRSGTPSKSFSRRYESKEHAKNLAYDNQEKPVNSSFAGLITKSYISLSCRSSSSSLRIPARSTQHIRFAGPSFSPKSSISTLFSYYQPSAYEPQDGEGWRDS
jgi:hypothetical protein